MKHSAIIGVALIASLSTAAMATEPAPNLLQQPSGDNSMPVPLVDVEAEAQKEEQFHDGLLTKLFNECILNSPDIQFVLTKLLPKGVSKESKEKWSAAVASQMLLRSKNAYRRVGELLPGTYRVIEPFIAVDSDVTRQTKVHGRITQAEQIQLYNMIYGTAGVLVDEFHNYLAAIKTAGSTEPFVVVRDANEYRKRLVSKCGEAAVDELDKSLEAHHPNLTVAICDASIEKIRKQRARTRCIEILWQATATSGSDVRDACTKLGVSTSLVAQPEILGTLLSDVDKPSPSFDRFKEALQKWLRATVIEGGSDQIDCFNTLCKLADGLAKCFDEYKEVLYPSKQNPSTRESLKYFRTIRDRLAAYSGEEAVEAVE